METIEFLRRKVDEYTKEAEKVRIESYSEEADWLETKASVCRDLIWEYMQEEVK